MITLKRLRFISVFAGARGAQFLAPIAAANLMSAADYGTVEFGFAVASIIVTFATLGSLGLLPFLMMGSLANGTVGAIALHLGALTAGSAMVAAADVATSGSVTVLTMVTVFISLLIVQGYWVVNLRARGDATKSLLLEASPFILVSIAALLARWVIPGTALPMVAGILMLAVLLLIGRTAPEWKRLDPLRTSKHAYMETMRHSMPLMLGGLLAMVAFTTGRLGAGFFGGAESAGIYAILSRIAALPIVAHQLAVVAKFREIYLLETEDLQRLAIKVSTFVTLSALVAIAVLPHISQWLGGAYHIAFSNNPAAGLILVAQVILWSGISLNDTIAVRHAVLNKIIPWTGATMVLTMALAALTIHLQGASIMTFALWHTGIMLSLFGAQSLSMAVRGVKHQRFSWICLGFFAATVAFAALTVRLNAPATGAS